MNYNQEEYKLYLQMNNLEDNKENLASFLIGNGADMIFNKDAESNIKQGIELYKEMGRNARLWTCFSYSTKMTVDEFIEDLKSGLEPFAQNMKNLGKDRMWAEDWIQTLASWSEMEKGDFD